MKGEFYKMDFRAWNVGTVELTLEQEAAYLRLCHAMYDVGGPVPNSSRFLQSIFRCGNVKAAALVKQLVEAGKIQVVEGGKLGNRRVMAELSARELVSAVRRVAGGKGGSAGRVNGECMPSDVPVTPEWLPCDPSVIPECMPSDASVAASNPLENKDSTEAIAYGPESRGEEIRGEEKREEKSKNSGTSYLRCAHETDYPKDAFEAWWKGYPLKVGKHAAEKSFAKARKDPAVTFKKLTDGVTRYKETKPVDQAWCHPTTWLNQGRWEDEQGTDHNRSDNSHHHRRQPAGGAAIAAGLALVAAHRGLGSRVGPGDHRHGDEARRRPQDDDPSILDADWTPAQGDCEAHLRA